MKCLRCGAEEQTCLCDPAEKSANRYRPWLTEGITEVEYWKRAYLEERKSASSWEDAMTWTTDPPTKPGWYWALERGMSRYVVVEVIPNLTPHDFCVWDDATDECVALEVFVRWAGPIPEPEEA